MTFYNFSAIDASIIHAPNSTKNKEKKRDPEMHSTKKGNQYYFGMKVHVGADVNTGVVHTASITLGNVADIKELPKLLREDDKSVFGTKQIMNINELQEKQKCTGGVNIKTQPKKKPARSTKYKNKKRSSIRARVEHVFRVMKIQFGDKKVRYKEIVKNASQVFMLIGLTNLYLMRKSLLARQESCIENMEK